MEQVGDSPGHAHEGEGGEEEVPVREGRSEVKGLALGHVFLAKVAEGHVGNDKANGDHGVLLCKVHTSDGIVGLLKGGVGVFEEGERLEELLELLAARVDEGGHN